MKSNLHEVVFGSSQLDRWSGYVVPVRESRWCVRIVVSDRATGKRRTLNRTLNGTREDAEAVLADALQRGQQGYDVPFAVPEALEDLSPKLKEKIGLTGAMSEMLACSAVLKRGYDCFRSVAVTGACDIVALDSRTGRMCRIEVKTASRVYGDLKYLLRAAQKERHDVLALVVLKESKVEFRPDLDEWFSGLELRSCTSNA